MKQDIKHVAVIGAGTIGASWAAYFLSRGLSVTASDPSPGAPDLIRRMVENAWPILMRLGGKADANPNAWRFEADPVAKALPLASSPRMISPCALVSPTVTMYPPGWWARGKGRWGGGR